LSRLTELMADPSQGTADPAVVVAVDFVQQVVDRETMRWALQQLADRERETVLLRYYAGCTLLETARVMGVGTGTVKRYASDGLSKLYQALNGGNSAVGGKEGSR
jgi:RNA polymerase sigma factor (sigma-70 family)